MLHTDNASDLLPWQTCRVMVAYPDICQENCLNIRGRSFSGSGAGCTLCHDTCPADAINFSADHAPLLDETHCTKCTACVSICPADAISHADVYPVSVMEKTREIARLGKTRLRTACSAVAHASVDVEVPCHAGWDPLLLTCMASEGIRILEVEGITQCATCSIRHGEKILKQTERNYATLNNALDVHLEVRHVIKRPENEKAPAGEPEPARRTFFRNLIPTLVQTAAQATAQLKETTSREDGTGPETSPLPIRLQLFLRALPRLAPNFTPIPDIPGIPLGAIQADARCTACGQCVEECPTQALALRPFGSNSVLEFKPHACTGCMLCVASCPEHALEALPGISLPVVATRLARPLVMVPVKKTGTASSVSAIKQSG